MKFRSFSLLLLTLVAGSVQAQVKGNYLYNSPQDNQLPNRNPASQAMVSDNPSVAIEINGLMNIVADHYVAVFNLVQAGDSAAGANAQLNSRIDAFKAALAPLGTEVAGSIKTDLISFVPKYGIETESKVFSKTYNEVPDGFEIQKNVYVAYRRSEQLDDIVTAAASAEIYDLVKVDYFIPNIQHLRDSLRMRCLQAVKSRAESFGVIGVRLDTVRKVVADQFTTVYPQTRYFGYQAYARPNPNAYRKRSGALPVVNEAQKSVSRYYSAIDYDRYDLVMNPVITEPVVQVSYSVAVRYFMKEEAPPKQLYYFMAPNGDMKQFYPR